MMFLAVILGLFKVITNTNLILCACFIIAAFFVCDFVLVKLNYFVNTEVEHTARLVGQTFANHNGEQTAEVDEARGAGGETSYLGAVGELTGRELGFDFLRRLGDVGEEKPG